MNTLRKVSAAWLSDSAASLSMIRMIFSTYTESYWGGKWIRKRKKVVEFVWKPGQVVLQYMETLYTGAETLHLHRSAAFLYNLIAGASFYHGVPECVRKHRHVRVRVWGCALWIEQVGGWVDKLIGGFNWIGYLSKCLFAYIKLNNWIN